MEKNITQEYSKQFEKVLDNDEKVLGVFKPHKGKFFISNIILVSLCLLMFAVPGIIACLCPEEGLEPSIIGAIIVGAIYVFCVLGEVLFAAIYYKNLYYAYTNKRVIVRSGIFGVDFKSLDMSMIGAINVYVSVIDKIVNKDTGTVTFGSMASPMYNANGGSNYKFAQIKMPYEICKEIKAKIDEFKKESK